MIRIVLGLLLLSSFSSSSASTIDLKCGTIKSVLLNTHYDQTHGVTFFMNVGLEENDKNQNVFVSEKYLKRRAEYFKQPITDLMFDLKYLLIESQKLGGSACFDSQARIVISTDGNAFNKFKRMYPDLFEAK